jgi:hypothetical protein
VGLAGVGGEGVGLAGVGGTGVGLAGVGAAGVGLLGEGGAGVGFAGAGGVGVGMAGVGLTGVGGVGVGPFERVAISNPGVTRHVFAPALYRIHVVELRLNTAHLVLGAGGLRCGGRKRRSSLVG